MIRARRTIRMDDEEWAGFMRLLGPEWLRAKVRRELAKEARNAKCRPDIQINLGGATQAEASAAISKIGKIMRQGSQ